MASSSDQVERLLLLLPYLQSHPDVAVTQVMEVFGISRAQVMKDLEVLFMCGMPGGLPDDLIEVDIDAARNEGMITLTNASYLLRPMRFALDEAMSLVVALRVLAEIVTGEASVHVASAIAKLESLIDPERTPRVAIQVASGDQIVRDEVVTAIQEHVRLQLVYDGQSRGSTTRPVVDPARIDLVDGVAYLQAFSVQRQGWRTYRLDRIASTRCDVQPGCSVW